ncbi:MAG: PspC domain-containing protein [Actinobacteria bacterium]|nr:PspC domain-containing protein [Actinomycetota bacterium]
MAATRGRGLTFSTEGRTLYRSRGNRVIAGVAGGIAEYFRVDPTLVRLAWVALFIINFAAALIAYIVAAIVIPERPKE